MMKNCKFIFFTFSVLFTSFLHANSININLGPEATITGRIIQIMMLMAIISLAPSILIMVTSFTRLIVVFSLLRSGLGLQQTPPNIVLISLSLFLTAFIMGPTFETAYQNGIQPLIKEEIKESSAIEKAIEPFKKFMQKHVRQDDLELFVGLCQPEEKKEIQETKEIPLKVLVPSFMISELRRAFEIGFLLFLPFLVIDMVIASILMSMGMMMLPPIIISLPFKIIFFVIVDGWHLIAGSLIKSYG